MVCRALRSGRHFRKQRSAARGFTLVELMAVVAITAILAALAIASLRQRAFGADVTSAKVVVRSIVAAEEHYRSENQLYFNVNSGWYPAATFAKNTKMSFWRTPPNVFTDAETNQWRILGPVIQQPVSFGFKANAGLPTTTPAFQNELATVDIPANSIVEPWYVVEARTDTDGNGIGCMVGAASWTPEVVSINDGE